jgi:hypothetical protein
VFFVEQLTASRRPLRQIGAGRLTHQELAALLRSYNSLAGYSLWVHVAGNSPVPILIAPRPAGRTAAQRERTGFHDSTLLGPGHSFVAIVPDRVAQVSWSWPREFNTPTLSYLPPVTITATATENVAVDRSGRYLSPQTATWVAASGAVIAHYASPNSATEIETATPPPRRKPAPQTALSRRAERNPSTSNRVVVVPSNGTTSTAFSVLFRALLNGHAYAVRLTGPHPDCATGSSTEFKAALSSPFVRGEIIQTGVGGATRCPGTYRVSVSVLAHRPAYRPFGSATFTIR